MSVHLLCCKPMFRLVFAFSAAFTVFVVLTVCLSVVYFVCDFIINKYKCCRTVTTSVTDCCSGWSGDSCNERKYSRSIRGEAVVRRPSAPRCLVFILSTNAELPLKGRSKSKSSSTRILPEKYFVYGGSVAEWLACWTQAQKGPGSNRSRDAVG